jgi:septum site-determining protein MinC
MVAFRGTKQGLSIELGDDADFGTVIELLAEKVRSGGRFFAGAEVTVDSGGRALTGEEREQIAVVLGANGLTLAGIRSGAARSSARRESTPRREGAGREEPESGTLVITRTLRSGQKIRHNGDVIVLGDLNPGAEVVAAGHIVVMGALRGVAHAGATGSADSIVAAVRLNPTQLRIAQVIARAPDERQGDRTKPEVARIRDGMIVLDTPSQG